MMRRLWLVSATALFAAIAATPANALGDPPAAPAPAAPPSQPAPDFSLVTVTLTNGDTFHATIVNDADPLVVDHPLLGRMTIARERIKSVSRDAASAAPPLPTAAAPAPPPPVAPTVVIAAPLPPPAPSPAPQLPMAPPPEPSLLELWKFSVEAGLNGTAGANNVQSFRALISGTRPTPEMSTSAAVGWWYSRTNDETSAQRVQLDARNEWPASPKSSWSYFVAAKTEYDEFQSWDWRLSGYGGVGCKLIEGEPFTLTGRTAFGASREFGIAHPDVHAEFVPSVDLEFKINPRNRICGSATAWIDLESSDGAHANLKAWYEAVLDPDHGMSLKLGVEDRFEHSPGLGREKHEVDYYAVIVFNF